MSHPSHARQPGRRHLPWVVSSALLLTVLLRLSPAQVRTAITPDASLGTTVTAQGTVHTLTGGTRPGNGRNLFHSLERFSLGTREVADFRAPTGVANILSRVTGGQMSEIDGTLRSTIDGTTRSTANLYLLNPAGVLFGPNARLEVGGAFHVSTADYLRLADGARFSAHLSDTSTLSVAAPEAFGFLRDNPSGIALQGSQLQVPDGATLALVGGQIQISGGRSAPDPSAPPTLGAPQGRVTVVSVAAPGEVNPHGGGQEVQALPSLGAIQITNGARLDTSGEGGGTITIRGGSLAIERALLAANTVGARNGAPTGIDIQATGEVIIRQTGQIVRDNEGRVVRTEGITTHAGPDRDVVSTGNAGALRLVADRVQLVDALLGSEAWQVGNAGTTVVQAREIILSDGARLSGTTRGAGQGGTVTVTATATLALQGTSPQGTASGVFADTVGAGAGSGKAGAVIVRAREMLLSDGARIGSTTAGPGRGGDVTVVATETLTLRGDNLVTPGLPTGVFVRALGAGDAGTGTVQARHIVLNQGAQINGSTLGAGRGGTVTVRAAETLTLHGISADGPGGLRAEAEGSGAAGSATVQARDIVLGDGAAISGSTGGAGEGGAVTVMAAETLTLQGTSARGPSGIFAQALQSGAAGSATVQARDIVLSDGAEISGTTGGSGRGGAVTVTAAETLTLRGSDSQGKASGVFADTVSTLADAGDAGSVGVRARDIALSDGANIGSVTRGAGHGGDVTVAATETLTLRGDNLVIPGQPTGVFVRAAGGGDAGTMIVQARDMLVSDGAQIALDALSTGHGGAAQITVAETLTMTGMGFSPRGSFASGIFANTEEETNKNAGAAGTIDVWARNILLSDGARISAATFGPGHGGKVTVTATETLTLQGPRSDKTVPAGILASTAGNVEEAGAAGTVDVRARTIVLSDGARISSTTTGTGSAGRVAVTATEMLTLRGTSPDSRGTSINPDGLFHSGLFAQARGTGDGGTVVVRAQDISLSDGGQIGSDTRGAGQGGTLEVSTAHGLTLTGQQTSLRTSAEGRGAGGHIVVEASAVRLTAGAAISAQSTGSGAAGTIRLTATDTLLLQGHSAVTTEAQRAPGGAIRVAARTLVRLQDSAITTSVQGGDGKAGNITIDPQFVVLQNSQIRASAVGGPGGNITLRAGVFLKDPASAVNASSEQNIAGTIDIRAPVANLSGIVAPLPQTVAAAEGLLRNRCLARLREGTVSTLVVRGREGSPTPPDGVLPGQLMAPPAVAETAPLPTAPLGASRGPRRPPAGGALPPHVLVLGCGS